MIHVVDDWDVFTALGGVFFFGLAASVCFALIINLVAYLFGYRDDPYWEEEDEEEQDE